MSDVECKHENVFRISVKGSDGFWFVWPDGTEGEGYAPNVPSVCNGDYLEVRLCCDCAKVLPSRFTDGVLSPDSIAEAKAEWEEKERQRKERMEAYRREREGR